MDFLKKNASLFLIATLILIVSIELELRVFGFNRPYYSFLILAVVVIVCVQIVVYSELEKYVTYKFNEIQQFNKKQETMNRSLMFVVEEIVDQGRANETKA